MEVEVHVSLWGGVGARHTGSTPEAGQEQRPASDHPSAGLPVGRTSCVRSWAAAVLEGSGCVLSLEGTWKGSHIGDIFSSLTPAPAQEAELPPLTPVVPPKDADARANLEVAPHQEGCPPAAPEPPPAAGPGAHAASLGLTEAPPPRSEERFPETGMAPAREDEFPLENASGPALEPLVEIGFLLPPEYVLPPLFDLFLLFSIIVTFSFSQQRASF